MDGETALTMYWFVLYHSCNYSFSCDDSIDLLKTMGRSSNNIDGCKNDNNHIGAYMDQKLQPCNNVTCYCVNYSWAWIDIIKLMVTYTNLTMCF